MTGEFVTFLLPAVPDDVQKVDNDFQYRYQFKRLIRSIGAMNVRNLI